AAALTELPPGLVRRLLNALTRLAQRSPDALLFTVTAALGSGFISASLPQLRAFFLAQLSEPQRLRLGELTADLRKNCGGWLRAQLQLLLITFFELLAALLILRVRRPVAAAALTALVDALPVFGVGAVLLPWAAIALLRGSTRLALGLTLSYGIISLVRNALQAKLLGDQIGLAPLPSLLSAYAGWKLCGVWGALLFPLLAVTLVQLNERGVVRLWRDP
ncbi:MAG: AI-2E family transporter, partial [Oscillospiraceae bacterium]|nr:AI-2E family transporter [Oscillospiraceae bacterium]